MVGVITTGTFLHEAATGLRQEIAQMAKKAKKKSAKKKKAKK
jgi:hypothetical protein